MGDACLTQWLNCQPDSCPLFYIFLSAPYFCSVCNFLHGHQTCRACSKLRAYPNLSSIDTFYLVAPAAEINGQASYWLISHFVAASVQLKYVHWMTALGCVCNPSRAGQITAQTDHRSCGTALFKVANNEATARGCKWRQMPSERRWKTQANLQ